MLKNIKITPKFTKDLKNNKSKIGLDRFLKLKLSNGGFDKLFELCDQTLKQINHWTIKKVDMTSRFGRFRLILAKRDDDKIICHCYFKNQKIDLLKEDIEYMKEFLLECDDQEFYDNLNEL
jgi:mRNA-degrading endonuclease RelE of RelBE toxin-antitoxin system